MAKKYNTISVNTENRVVWISLNRPDVHNAMNAEMIAELTNCFSSLSEKTEYRAVVLSGNGKSFCAGADLNYMKSIAAFGFEENVNDAKKLASLFKSIYDCKIPTIALVHGAVFGGANGLISACDIVVAEENSTFAFSEVKLGIAPATIGPFVINRIGEFGAKELMLTGKRFKAEEAKRWNLVNHIFKQGEDKPLKNILKEFDTAAPEAVRATKQLIKEIQSDETDDVFNYTAKLIAKLRASEEGQEGMAAFLEKRKPNYHNKNINE